MEVNYGCLILILPLMFLATTSLGASIFAVIRSCLGVSLLYGLCYAGLRVTISKSILWIVFCPPVCLACNDIISVISLPCNSYVPSFQQHLIQCDGVIDCCITMISSSRAYSICVRSKGHFRSSHLEKKEGRSIFKKWLNSWPLLRTQMLYARLDLIILITPYLLPLSIWIQITIPPLSTDGAIVI